MQYEELILRIGTRARFDDDRVCKRLGGACAAALPFLSDEQMEEVAARIARIWPTRVKHMGSPPLVWRMFFEGTGGKDPRLESNHTAHTQLLARPEQWNKHDQFMEKVVREMAAADKVHGACVAYEMWGHRLGDRAMVLKSPRFMQLATDAYESATTWGLKLPKHKASKCMWTPLYWCGVYQHICGYHASAVTTHLRMFDLILDYKPGCPDGIWKKIMRALEDMTPYMSTEELASLKQHLIHSGIPLLVKGARGSA